MSAAAGRLAGRVALVTGAAGDIGRAVALRLARDGAAVVATDLERAQDALRSTVEACEGAGAVARGVALDVTDDDAVDDAVAAIARELGPPDAVVTSAGYQGAFEHTARYPVGDVRVVLDVNVVGTFTVVRSCAAALIAAGRPGAMLLVSSMAGVSGAPNMPAYAASKAAVLGLARSAAKDLAPDGIRVNAISPAFIGPGVMWDRQVALQAAASSRYYADTPEEVAAQMIGQVPLGRYGSVDEVASVAAFLLSDDASYVTGTNTEVSGGAA